MSVVVLSPYLLRQFVPQRELTNTTPEGSYRVIECARTSFDHARNSESQCL